MATKKKKASEAKAVQERREEAEAKAQVTRYEAHAKTLVPVGELILALDLELDIEPGVRLLGVTNLVSDLFIVFL